uniref:ATP synthase F0 subunit 8 n=1 Tax=Haemaphysalis japonica TaxID=558168 RepID=A0A343UTF4_9ACAR|nr:ATP synthase F0 subunit 8 [Haemaphysalis japonica]AVI15561.1 ATP synthase F0 subunit 8 [Haemaphysalis japonica]
MPQIFPMNWLLISLIIMSMIIIIMVMTFYIFMVNKNTNYFCKKNNNKMISFKW